MNQINKEYTEKAIQIIINDKNIADQIAKKCGMTNQELYKLLTEETINDCKMSIPLYKVLKYISEIKNDVNDNE